jgi:hypothetical protein
MAIGGGGGDHDEGALRLKLADPQEATYAGRVRKNFHMLDFRLALTTAEQVQDATRLVAAKGMRLQ